jgi:hypothetical protein
MERKTDQQDISEEIELSAFSVKEPRNSRRIRGRYPCKAVFLLEENKD